MKADGEDRGVVFKTMFFENPQSPRLCFFDDCERRCTEAKRTLLYAAVFKSLKRPRQIFLKLVGSDFGEQQMVVAVNGNLVPFPLNFANQFGQALGDVHE